VSVAGVVSLTSDLTSQAGVNSISPALFFGQSVMRLSERLEYSRLGVVGVWPTEVERQRCFQNHIR
jgi:hypothetical protein